MESPLTCPDILTWWLMHESYYPILARIARDFLAIPVAGVGVENLFNSARDICHYRRSQLAPDTIEASITQMCNDRFQLKEEFLFLQDQMDDNITTQVTGSASAKDVLEVITDDRISDEEDEGGLEDDEGLWDEQDNEDDEDLLLFPTVQPPTVRSPTVQPPTMRPPPPPVQSSTNTQSSQPLQLQITENSRSLRHQNQSPGHYHRLNNGR